MKILGVVLMASALVMSSPTAATNAAPAGTEALAREADAFFKDQQPGGVVLVTQGDQVLLRRAYGMADIEDGVAMRPDAALATSIMPSQRSSPEPSACTLRYSQRSPRLASSPPALTAATARN
ncbi:hypothetical protein [Stenotrophomonas sp. TWI587]|uniref:hypothetical protein n=1 Tax=Stenotrophomonas sp. TWI587 TaxID=3136783 RepID=UPI00320B1B8A